MHRTDSLELQSGQGGLALLVPFTHTSSRPAADEEDAASSRSVKSAGASGTAASAGAGACAVRPPSAPCPPPGSAACAPPQPPSTPPSPLPSSARAPRVAPPAFGTAAARPATSILARVGSYFFLFDLLCMFKGHLRVCPSEKTDKVRRHRRWLAALSCCALSCCDWAAARWRLGWRRRRARACLAPLPPSASPPAIPPRLKRPTRRRRLQLGPTAPRECLRRRRPCTRTRSTTRTSSRSGAATSPPRATPSRDTTSTALSVSL